MYLPSSSSSLPISALPKRRFSHPFPKYQVRRNRSTVFLVPGLDDDIFNGRERSIEISSRRRAKERRIWMARTFLTEGIESPVLGPAQAKKERARAPTPPRFQQRSTLFSLFPPFFPLSRASLVVAPPRLRLASIGQAAIGPWTQSFTENVECRRSRDSSTGARERERERRRPGV